MINNQQAIINGEDEDDEDNYLEPYVTDEEDQFGFWYFGHDYQLGIFESNSHRELVDDDDDLIEDRLEFHRLVLSSQNLSHKMKDYRALSKLFYQEEFKKDSNKCWPVSSIHCTSAFTAFFIGNVRDQFMLCRVVSPIREKWSIISSDHLPVTTNNTNVNTMEQKEVKIQPLMEFNRVLCCGRYMMIFEMTNRKVYMLKLKSDYKCQWKELVEFNSSQIECISGSIHCLTISFIKEDSPMMIYFILWNGNIESRNVGMTIRKIFTPFTDHVIIDSENRYYEEKDTETHRFEYVQTPFEKKSPIQQVVGGFYFTIVLLEDGTVWIRGDNDRVLSRRNEESSTFYQIDISIPNVSSVTAFGNYGVISTPSYHLFFGDFSDQLSVVDSMRKKRNGIKMSQDLKNMTIVETENKYFHVDGFEQMIFVYKQLYKPIMTFQKKDSRLFRIRLFKSCLSIIQCDISFKFCSNNNF